MWRRLIRNLRKKTLANHGLQNLKTHSNNYRPRASVQESALENIRKNAALINEQRKLAETLSTSLERARASLATLETRLAEKESERAAYADLVSRAKEIESAYKAWQKARKELEELDKSAMEFREHHERRQPYCARSKWKRRSWSRSLKC